MKPSPKVPLETALKAMQRHNAALIHESGAKARWFVDLAGEVSEATAAAIRERPDVCGGKDALWPGLDQTWRIAR